MAARNLCSVPDCGKPARSGASPFCNSHYYRNLRHGSPMGGRTPFGEPLRWIRDHASCASDDCLPWPYCRSNFGYGLVARDGKMMNASRVMCEVVNGPPPTPDHEAAHSCGKGHEGCMAPRHLSWKTVLANNADKISHGTMVRGEAMHTSKLTERQVLEIRDLSGKHRDIAARYGVCQTTISSIKRRSTWAWL